jgi:hypothetical protein
MAWGYPVTRIVDACATAPYPRSPAQRLALIRLAYLMCGSRDLSEDLVLPPVRLTPCL